MPVSTPLLEAVGVGQRFGALVVLDGVDFTLGAGEAVGVVGPNGAGKTTTIRMVLNIIEPDTGTITVLGQPAASRGLTDRLGYLPEERGLYRKMRVREVLRFLAELKGVHAAEADRRITRWLDRFALRTDERDWGDARVEELSRGMQQKVQFIGALLHEPQLVVLDEPFSGLDPVNAQALKDTVLALRKEGRTVILSTHIIENAESMCDGVCIIANGGKVLDGGVAEVRTRYGGPPVERTVMVQPSLHEIFLQQVGATGVEPGMHGHG